jgi:hypothetical protein
VQQLRVLLCDSFWQESCRGLTQWLTTTAYEPHPDGTPVYNFQVEGYHTYFVAERASQVLPVLVHNADSYVPKLIIDYNEYPELADNIWHAQRAGHPTILAAGGNRAANRAAALDDVPNIKPFSRDEYPFASTREGGARLLGGARSQIRAEFARSTDGIRRCRTACFNGCSTVTSLTRPCNSRAVFSQSGRVNIEGPEEEADQRHLQLAAGDYRLWCTQRGVNDQLQQVHLFFEKLPSPLERSSIITADEDLCPPDELVETSEVAEV